MIKKLRFKFIIVCTVSVLIVLIAVMLCVNIFNFSGLNERADTLITYIEDNNGVLPKPGKEKEPVREPFHEPPKVSREAMFDTRFFTVFFDESNNIVSTDTGNIYLVTSDTAKGYAKKILKSDNKSGFINGYKYHVTTVGNKKAIIFLDVSKDIDMAKNFLINSGLISVSALALVIIVSYFLSPFAVKPIAESYEKQKKFITNASHEIKTPLTVISTNIDIMEMSGGKSKWIDSSKEQIVRLTDLVNSLVALSRMEEDNKLIKTQFDISSMSQMAAESYSSTSLLSKKAFSTDIEENININGNAKSLNQLLYILLDNAFKYCDDNGTVKLSLKKLQGRIHLTVSNSVKDMKEGSYNELFDRFYRLDESRNSDTGGYGIGLSLAKSIVEKHNGKITAQCDSKNTFSVTAVL